MRCDDLVFMMGKFPAKLPGNLRYARNHLWCQVGDRLRFGFTAYAIRLMQDVYFLEWHLSPGPVEMLQEIGFIESSKANSALFAPLTGTITQFNQALMNDPSLINVDGYGEGWLFEMEASPGLLMTAEQYQRYLDENWEKTQALIKGKINAED
jgi:glycine cleavage system H protein